MKTYRHVLYWVLTIAMASCIHMLMAQTSDQAIAAEKPKVRSVFYFEKPLPELPSHMLVYRTLEPSISKRHIKQLLTTIELDAEINDVDDILFVHHGEHVIEVCKRPHTGYFRYSDDDKLSLQKPARNLPSKEDGINSAARLLVEHGLMPKASPTPRTGYFQYGVIDSKGEWVEHARSALAVGFTFKVDGYRFVGPGAKAGVVFGENGQIIAVSRIWREIKADRNALIHPVDHALDLFKKYWPSEGEKGEQSRADILTTVRIEEIYLAYFTQPGTITQMYIEPVYVFEGTFVVRGQVEREAIQDSDQFRIVIPALTER